MARLTDLELSWWCMNVILGRIVEPPAYVVFISRALGGDANNRTERECVEHAHALCVAFLI